MPRQKRSLNTVYISERLQESLRPISGSALTTVVAPMGYGKTTAVNWYLSQREKEGKTVIRVSVYSDHLAILWKSVQTAFSRAGFPFFEDYPCPADPAGGSLLIDDLCHELADRGECFLFLDDFHLLTDRRVPGFLCALANRLPEKVHFIVVSRDRFLSGEETLRLGARLWKIGREQLQLNHTELSVYARRCGAMLSEEQIDTLLYTSEGWFSAVYLNLCTLAERGELPEGSPDIYAMFSAALIDPLPKEQREFLAVMGLADEFTVSMAQKISGREDAGVLLSALTRKNAFVTRLPDGATYRFHHMMKACAEQAFSALPIERQRLYRDRYGRFYETGGQYLHALSAYGKSGNFAALCRVVQEDAGILLASLDPSLVLEVLGQCPKEVLKEYPLAILVLMRSMFNWRQIPKMLELKALFSASMEEHPELPAEERGNLLGECDLIQSFLFYNNITEMSRLHRSASQQMSRPSVSIRSQGGWTFGSPSVLMMFHREPGGLKSELAEMDECMPHYYKITNGHGQGAERIMRGEAAFLQGRFADAKIALEEAYAAMAGNGQTNMVLCCDFLERRLSLFTDTERRCSFEERREQVRKRHNVSWLNLLSSIESGYYALLGEMEKIPELFREHRLSDVHFLAPGKPMMELIENQVDLAQGAYARVIGRSGGLLAQCAALHYGLVALQTKIQTAAAYEKLGKRPEARALVKEALKEADPDGFVIPFAENHRYLAELLESMKTGEDGDFVKRILAFGEEMEARLEKKALPEELSDLTERELLIARLISERLSNREIAERLFLSEGSVKQYVNRIYGKLHIEGDTRTKRKRLSEKLLTKG